MFISSLLPKKCIKFTFKISSWIEKLIGIPSQIVSGTPKKAVRMKLDCHQVKIILPPYQNRHSNNEKLLHHDEQ